MRHKLIGLLEQSPVIPAVKDETALTRAAGCESRVLFLLGGDLLTIPGWIARTHEAGSQRKGPLTLSRTAIPLSAGITKTICHTTICRSGISVIL